LPARVPRSARESQPALNAVGYEGSISIEWEDAGMDRLVGAPDALAFVRAITFDAAAAAFDSAFSQPDPPTPHATT
jgi:hypothetical protein